jgi:hypothetical protein
MGHGKTLVQELEQRGYDITTLQFSVKRKFRPNEKPEPHATNLDGEQGDGSKTTPESE